MRNDRQVYFSGNFASAGTSYAAPIKAMDKQSGFSVLIILGAFVMLGIVCDMIISRI